jgi:hypothetical protein
MGKLTAAAEAAVFGEVDGTAEAVPLPVSPVLVVPLPFMLFPPERGFSGKS